MKGKMYMEMRIAVFAAFMAICFVAFASIAIAEKVGNAEVIDALDTAKEDIEDLNELLQKENDMEIGAEIEALESAKNRFEEGKLNFRKGSLGEAFGDFQGASNAALEAQTSLLEKRYLFDEEVTEELIKNAEVAGIGIEEFKKSLDSVKERYGEVREEKDEREKIKRLKEIVDFSSRLRVEIKEIVGDAKREAEKEIATARGEVQKSKVYLTRFMAEPANEQLELAEKEYNDGRYFKALSFALSAREISEDVTVLGKIVYVAIVAVISITVWVVYERSKPESKRSKLYRKISRIKKGGDVHVSNW
jgi:hypothetical protein